MTRPRITRMAATTPSGPTPTMYTIGSATSTQASSTAVSTGTRQPGRIRSSTSQVSISGIEVPMWPTDRSRANTPAPNCGASRMPPAISVLIQAARPEEPLRARITASRTTSV